MPAETTTTHINHAHDAAARCTTAGQPSTQAATGFLDPAGDPDVVDQGLRSLLASIPTEQLFHVGFQRIVQTEVTNSDELAELMAGVESVTRQATAVSIDLLTLSRSTKLHYQDGHSSGGVMMRHVTRLSGAEAVGRDKCARMFQDLPVIASAYRTGQVGTQQVMLLGRVFANNRVAEYMADRQQWFLDRAQSLSFKRFHRRVLEWERLMDQDGTEPRGDRVARNRTATLRQDETDLSFDLAANFPSLDGATNKQVFDSYIDALFDADWAEAKQLVGDTVCKADLARTDAQRAADALTQIFSDAAANPKGMAPMTSGHTIVWSQEAHAEMARQFAGAPARPFKVDTYRCETLSGVPLDPVEAFADSVVNNIRRVVIDAQGVVIDMGRARKFTGLARDAVQITGRECYWPGCWQPSIRCDIDHLHDHAHGGRTNPGNGAPACGRHNRWKQKGYKVFRDPTGAIHVQRPNGTTIRNA